MVTADRLLQRRGGRLRGLASVRLFLVAATVALQSVEVSESYARFNASPLWILFGLTIPALFALLGFNMVLAAERRAPFDLVKHRILFVLPPLALAVALAALAIGPLVTSVRLRRYFTDADTWSYLLNLAALPRFALPGVFEFNNAADTVNAVLWSVPVYALSMLSLVLVLGLRRGRPVALLALIVVTFAIGPLLAFSRPVATSSLCFLLAALAALYRTRMPVDWRIATAAALPIIVVAFAGQQMFADFPWSGVLLAPAITYLAVFAALAGLANGAIARRLRWYLIGCFLFSYPVQQLVVAIGPPRQNGLLNFVLSLPVIVLLSVGSWHFVQKPIVARLLGAELQPEAVTVAGRKPFAQAIALARTTLPMVLTALLIALVAVAMMAMVFFALQRDAVGV